MSAISYKCPNCGGDLQFDPETQQYKCEYCISNFSQAELEKANPAVEEERAEERKAPDGSGAVVYTCPSCGAEIVTDETTAATFCFYCHNPVVLKGRLEGEWLPEKVIPFKISRKKAEEQFLAYVKKKKFIPHAFFNKKQIEKLSGVYFPYWVCTEDMEGTMKAKATKIRIWRGGDIEYTETRYYDVERSGDIQIRELTRNALSKADRKLVEGVQPFPMEECREFSMGYLSGFQAEKRDLERSDFQEEVCAQAKNYAEGMLKDSISGYNTVVPKDTRIHIRREQWDYVLLPVWTLTYQGKNDKVYYYAMNGVTGNVCGELPLDYKKVALLFLAVALPVLLLCLMGGYLL